jgi:deoxyribonuclease IV
MVIKFGPAGLGSVKDAVKTLEDYHKKGFRACEIAFTYSVYIKHDKDAEIIRKKTEELGIHLSIHAPYFVNLNSAEMEKRKATKERILNCCRIGEKLGVKTVVFHPGYYTKNKSSLSRKLPHLKEVSDGYDREKAYDAIRDGIKDLMKELKKNKWKIQIAPETMGKINVFGSIDEISRLVKDTGCSFCIDFAHILARDKKIDYDKVEKLFPQKKWHVHFSGIVYGEKGEKHHKTTEKKEWEGLLKKLPKDKEIVIINESPTMIEDSVRGLKLSKKFGH